MARLRLRNKAILIVTCLAWWASLARAMGGVQGSDAQTEGGAAMLRGVLTCFSKRGRWAYNPKPRKVAWIRESYGRETQCDRERGVGGWAEGEEADGAAERGQPWRVREDVKWRWEMERCPWEEFSYEKFCKRMSASFGANASVLIIGDELAWGFERRFFYAMLAGAAENYFPVNLFPNGCLEWDKGRDRKLCSGYRYCHDVLGGRSVAVRFVRSGNLSLTRHTEAFQNTPWISAMSFWRPSVVLMSHSAHDVDDETFTTNLAAAAHWVTGRYRETLFIYRSTPTGSTFCPDLDPQSASQPPEPQRFPNSDYERQNKLAKSIANMGGLFLDVDPTIKSRPAAMLNASGQSDGCFSLCRPGPIDAWVDLFYNTLAVALPKVDLDQIPTVNGAHVQTLEERTRVKACEALPPLGQPLPQLQPPRLPSPIPGSRLKTAKAAERVRKKIECFMTSGKWVYNPTPRRLPWLLKPWGLPSIISRCDQRQVWRGGIFGPEADAVAERGGNWSVREDLKYEWRTPQCPLEPFSRKGFCEAAGPGRSILLVGDSMTSSFERHIFFNLLMGSDTEKYPPVDVVPDGGKEYDIGLRRFTCRGTAFCHEHFAARPVTVRFCFNRAVSLTRVPLDGEAPWVTLMEKWRPTVLVLNRGAHFCDDPVFEKGVRDTFEYLRKNHPDTLVFWRNTPPGHVQCMQHARPAARRQAAALLPRAYHWADFATQNAIARRVAEAYGGVYLDVDNATSLRVDGHRGSNDAGAPDCLHYCQPGPEDTWAQLLYNALRELL